MNRFILAGVVCSSCIIAHAQQPTPTPSPVVILHKSPAKAVAFLPDGKTLVSASGSELILWNLETQTQQPVLKLPSDCHIVALSFDGKLLATGSGYDKGKIRLWDVQSSKLLHTMTGQWGLATLSFSSDGGSLASAGANTSDIKLWDTKAGKLRRVLKGSSEGTSRVAFSRDDKMLVGAGNDYLLRWWDTTTGQPIRTARRIGAGYVFAFSPNGQFMVNASVSASDMWNLQTGKLAHKLPGNKSLMRAVTFSPDGSIIAGGGNDKTVMLWDVPTGTLKRTFKDSTNSSVQCLAFSPDGTILASGHWDGTVKLWHIEQKPTSTQPGAATDALQSARSSLPFARR